MFLKTVIKIVHKLAPLSESILPKVYFEMSTSLNNMFIDIISGDMLATLLDNLEGNIHMPTGCGEQNMIGLVPSLAIAKYFKALDRFGPDIAKKVAKYTAVGKVLFVCFNYLRPCRHFLSQIWIGFLRFLYQ